MVLKSIFAVSELLHIGRNKLVNDILLNPTIKQQVDIELNSEGFVIYPRQRGNPYRFLVSRTKEFFEKNPQVFLY